MVYECTSPLVRGKNGSIPAVMTSSDPNILKRRKVRSSVLKEVFSEFTETSIVRSDEIRDTLDFI